MTPKEKAEELYLKYTNSLDIRDLRTTANPFAKQCALIAVEELYQYSCSIEGFDEINGIEFNPYWQEVKKEIEAL